MSPDPTHAPDDPPRPLRAIDDPVALARGARIFRLALARADAHDAQTLAGGVGTEVGASASAKSVAGVVVDGAG